MINNEQELNGALNNEVVETGNYNKLENKPLINNVELSGNKTSDDLGIASKEDIPTVPTKVSELENDEGYLKEIIESDPTVPEHVKSITEENINEWNNKSTFSGNYDDLDNKPVIPTVPENVSSFTNDAGYITEIPEEYAKKEYVDDKIGDIETVLSTLTTITEEV